jgi:hypothetical protein
MSPRSEQTVEALAALARMRRLENRVADDLREDVIEAREFVERIIGPTIRASVLARVLGVSRPAIKTWLDRGEIATVSTPAGRREIPLTEAISLIEAVEAARRAGNERPIARVIRDRHEEARTSADLDRLVPPKPRTHRTPELQALAYHRAVAERLDERMVASARRKMQRWRDSGRVHPRWADAWLEILSRPVSSVAAAVATDSRAARELRQTSPFAGALTEQERRRLADAVERRAG